MEPLLENYENEYSIFFDDLLTEYEKYKLFNFKNIPFYGDLFFRDWRTDIEDDHERYLDLVSYYYSKYHNSITGFESSKTKKEIKDILHNSKNIVPPYGIVFHQMYWVVHDAAYFSISRLVPQFHKINQFFISYFNGADKLVMPHHAIFNFQYTPTSPWFRDYLRNHIEKNMDEVENAPMLILFVCPNNLTEYGREHIFEITDYFGEKLDSYYEQNSRSLLRSCITKRGGVNYRKLKKTLDILVRQSENELRAANHLPAVGDGWLEEIKLYYRIKDDLPDCVVVCHGKPLFLGNLHYDVWILKYKIAVEFQGEQHRRPIEYFGGEAAFIARQERDERKRQISIENDITLFCVEAGYNYSELIQKIKDVIGQS
jgi:hypothetical protein